MKKDRYLELELEHGIKGVNMSFIEEYERGRKEGVIPSDIEICDILEGLNQNDSFSYGFVNEKGSVSFDFEDVIYEHQLY